MMMMVMKDFEAWSGWRSELSGQVGEVLSCNLCPAYGPTMVLPENESHFAMQVFSAFLSD
jgi:hypothetical protein